MAQILIMESLQLDTGQRMEMITSLLRIHGGLHGVTKDMSKLGKITPVAFFKPLSILLRDASKN